VVGGEEGENDLRVTGVEYLRCCLRHGNPGVRK
jgi:hypothetical protein